MKKKTQVKVKAKSVVKPLTQIKGKKVASNIILTIDRLVHNKKVTKEEGDIILKKVEAYNKKPSEKAKEAIKALMTTKLTAAKKIVETKAIVKKLLEKRGKKENKKVVATEKNFLKDLEDRLKDKEEGKELNEDEITKLEQLLAKAKKVEEVKPAPVYTPTPRRGEY